MFIFLTKPTRATYCPSSGGWREDGPLPLEVCWNFKELNVGIDSARLRGAVNALSVRENGHNEGLISACPDWSHLEHVGGLFRLFFFFFFTRRLFAVPLRQWRGASLCFTSSPRAVLETFEGVFVINKSHNQEHIRRTFYDFVLLTSPKTNLCSTGHFQVMRGEKKKKHLMSSTF